MRWNTGKWIGKGRNHIHINGKKFAGEQDRSLFPGAGRLTSECSEHPHKALMGLIRRVSVLNDVSCRSTR